MIECACLNSHALFYHPSFMLVLRLDKYCVSVGYVHYPNRWHGRNIFIVYKWTFFLYVFLTKCSMNIVDGINSIHLRMQFSHIYFFIVLNTVFFWSFFFKLIKVLVNISIGLIGVSKITISGLHTPTCMCFHQWKFLLSPSSKSCCLCS